MRLHDAGEDICFRIHLIQDFLKFSARNVHGLDLFRRQGKIPCLNAMIDFIADAHEFIGICRQIGRIGRIKSGLHIGVEPISVQQYARAVPNSSHQFEEPKLLKESYLSTELFAVDDSPRLRPKGKLISETPGGVDHFLPQGLVQGHVLNDVHRQGMKVLVGPVVLSKDFELGLLADGRLGEAIRHIPLDAAVLLAHGLELRLIRELHPGRVGMIRQAFKMRRRSGSNIGPNPIREQDIRQFLPNSVHAVPFVHHGLEGNRHMLLR